MSELKLLAFSLTIPLLLLLIAFVFKNRKLLAIFCFIVGFLWLYLPSTPLVAYALAAKWQSVAPYSGFIPNGEPAQAIVVLSGGHNYTHLEYPQNRTLSLASLIRLRYGAELARLTNLPMLVSGGALGPQGSLSQADIMISVMQEEYGLDVKWREDKSHSTAENARHSSELLKMDNIESILLVTSALHMQRAAMSFERYGFTVTPAPTAFEKIYTKVFVFRLIPRAESFVLTRQVLHEMLGYWIYKHFTLPKV